MQRLTAKDFICLNDCQDSHALRVDLAYARADNLLFGERIYRDDARLWAHKDMARIILRAAEIVQAERGLRLVVYDCLRPVEAQEAMLETRRVQENPQWLQDPPMLSMPGAGAHPRGMAVDVGLETPEGRLLDMGTPFDAMCDDPSPEANRAHRDYRDLSDSTLQNRNILDGSMFGAARELGLKLVGLAQEWWDFRFDAETYGAYAPVYDKDLPKDMRMTG